MLTNFTEFGLAHLYKNDGHLRSVEKFNSAFLGLCRDLRQKNINNVVTTVLVRLGGKHVCYLKVKTKDWSYNLLTPFSCHPYYAEPVQVANDEDVALLSRLSTINVPKRDMHTIIPIASNGSCTGFYDGRENFGYNEYRSLTTFNKVDPARDKNVVLANYNKYRCWLVPFGNGISFVVKETTDAEPYCLYYVTEDNVKELNDFLGKPPKDYVDYDMALAYCQNVRGRLALIENPEKKKLLFRNDFLTGLHYNAESIRELKFGRKGLVVEELYDFKRAEDRLHVDERYICYILRRYLKVDTVIAEYCNTYKHFICQGVVNNVDMSAYEKFIEEQSKC
uniref:RNA ligase n=1 Tax=Syphacia muris TaxID=451379 RepID=A0A0N5AKI3_9BILA